MIKVSYTSTCKDGGYTANADTANTDTTLHADTSGCFTVAGGAINLDGTSMTPTGVVNKYRTLQGFSTQAQAKMSWTLWGTRVVALVPLPLGSSLAWVMQLVFRE